MPRGPLLLVAVAIALTSAPLAAAEPVGSDHDTPGPDHVYIGLARQGTIDHVEAWHERPRLCFDEVTRFHVEMTAEDDPGAILTLTLPLDGHNAITPPDTPRLPSGEVAAAVTSGSRAVIETVQAESCIDFTVHGTLVPGLARYTVLVDGALLQDEPD